MTRWLRQTLIMLGVAIVVAAPAWSAINVGSDGSDGVLDLPTDPSPCVGGIVGNVCEIDLGLAADAAWDTPSPVAGQGVYDAARWAVVFKYVSINIDAGTTVRFINHPSRAPVMWLVDTTVTINGIVDLDGDPDTGSLSELSEPGPGGFRGGRSYITGNVASPGFGPGGGQYGLVGCGGSYGGLGGASNCNAPGAGAVYGNDRVLPLIGGSGGAGRVDLFNRGGGAGGGAILIAADETITLEGRVQANGGNASGNGGSGGGIRLIADSVDDPAQVDPDPQINGELRAFGGSGANGGGHGRIRIEANSASLPDPGSPPFTVGTPCAGADCSPDIFPPTGPGGSPSVQVTNVAGVAAPADPRGSFDFPQHDVRFADAGAINVTVAAQNVPVDGSWQVKVRVTPRGFVGNYIEACASPTGDLANSTWTASVVFPNGNTAVQARAFEGTTCP